VVAKLSSFFLPVHPGVAIVGKLLRTMQAGILTEDLAGQPDNGREKETG